MTAIQHQQTEKFFLLIDNYKTALKAVKKKRTPQNKALIEVLEQKILDDLEITDINLEKPVVSEIEKVAHLCRWLSNKWGESYSYHRADAEYFSHSLRLAKSEFLQKCKEQIT